MRVLVATRNAGKVREIREMLAARPEIQAVGLAELGIEETEEEDAVEAFDTFEENALAKARYFARMTGELTLADDSGIAVDALGGAPGVRSRRFAPVDEARGERQDEANNRHLLDLLRATPDAERGARYVCSVALADAAGRETVFTGTCDGTILRAPRGTGGFGYDPLFYLEEEGMTFGELPSARKHEISHRGKAVRAAVEALLAGWGSGGG